MPTQPVNTDTLSNLTDAQCAMTADSVNVAADPSAADLLVYVAQNVFAFDDQHPLLFTQFFFWAFLAMVMLVLALIGSGRKKNGEVDRTRILMRNAFLFFVSIFFYYKTSGDFTLLLVITTMLTYVVGLQVGKAVKGLDPKAPAPRRAKLWVGVGILVTLSVLFYFKYSYLAVDMINQLFGTQLVVYDYIAELGNALTSSNRFSVDYIWLPVGISFYTFQCISYVMDIFRRRIEPLRNILNYGFYVSFFPQLVAGPIVRANEFVAQIERPYNLSRRWLGISIFWMLNGLAKKIILADYLAVNFADRVFTNPTMYGGFENFSALFVYSLQVYADFSGYTDIAIGVAMLMGFYLPRNFNSPYKATNCGGFWKRWHISLSKWLQDYLYIPMGGNRTASFGTYAVIFTIAVVGTLLSGSVWVAVGVIAAALWCLIEVLLHPEKKKGITSNVNRMNTMLLGGLWHGASWNFMIWGGLNGLGMLIWRTWATIGIHWRALITVVGTVVLSLVALKTEWPVMRMGAVWLGVIALCSALRSLYNALRAPWQLSWLERAWAITQTFVFVTFTRLFFRAGSNLDPAEANQVAWETATQMVAQIGSPWNTQQIPAIIQGYAPVFILFVLGMIIHWLPERFKRRYRLWFALMPLPLMAVVAVVIVIVIYQFVTADLQKFIYFQF